FGPQLSSIRSPFSTILYGSLQLGGRSVDIVKGNMGWIEVIVGPMFSGKSEELIRRLRRAEIARQRVQIFKPVIDQRYAVNEIVSHSGLGIRSDNVRTAAEVLERVEPRTEVIGIDEGQLLGELIVVGASGTYEARCRRCFEPQLAHEKVEAEKKSASEGVTEKARTAAAR